jgi:hypothetical protein
MFIGIVSINKDFVEKVNIEADTCDEAQSILAQYVFTNYNQEVPSGGYYYDGIVIDPSQLKTIKAEPIAC